MGAFDRDDKGYGLNMQISPKTTKWQDVWLKVMFPFGLDKNSTFFSIF